MTDISPNRLYTREELLSLIGHATFRAASAEGLRAIGYKYLGSVVLDFLAAAYHSKAVAAKRAASQQGAAHEEKKMGTSTLRQRVHTTSSRAGAREILSEMEGI